MVCWCTTPTKGGSTGDQFNTYPMLLSGMIMMEFEKGNIKQREWDQFEKETGEIDSYELLFIFTSNKMKNGSKNWGKIMWSYG